MKRPRRAHCVFSLFLLLLPALSYASAPDLKPAQILPANFAGWEMTSSPHTGMQADQADSANAAVLREYGFARFESADYAETGNKLAVRAIQFQDASGAFGAFTFYRRPGSIAEQIGRNAAWDGSHVLFWAGSVLVEATFDHLTAMSSAELRELAGDLPQPSGSANIPPSLPGYLPHAGLETGLTRYVLGGESYARSGGILPPSLVSFSAGSAEAVTAYYKTGEGSGELTLLSYPTPQFAAARLRDIQAFLKAGNTPQAAWPQPLADSHPDAILVRRTGPILAITSGNFSKDAAQKLLGKVNYEADVIWNNPQGYVGEGAKVAKLLLGIFALVGIVGGAAVLLGLFLGGGRALLRVLQGKPASRMSEETEFIRLKLDE